MGRTKALIEIDGRMMGDRVLDALRAVGADPIVIYGGDVDELQPLAADVIVDEFPGAGPVGGVLGALRHLSDRADAVLVVACDLAMVQPRTLQALINAASSTSTTTSTSEAGEAAPNVWVGVTSRVEPMCALWSMEALGVVEGSFTEGERALHRVIKRCVAAEVPVDFQDLININTPSDVPPHPCG
jgi:molybdopterin-guanine dinucleotide biosynthesis protein A